MLLRIACLRKARTVPACARASKAGTKTPKTRAPSAQKAASALEEQLLGPAPKTGEVSSRNWNPGSKSSTDSKP
eukprot:3601987-Rhodomonas_salina.3